MPTSEEYGCTLAELRALMELRGGEALEKVCFLSLICFFQLLPFISFTHLSKLIHYITL
ncbi:unnamed protein product [Nippostrongylus brasiliensis]|uniref:Uncharacterized protein n=1 Tax=Nippostrongylus brasiliensis TaxID=27835 RepID=A0A0N4YVX1_NIPBR|nr:unnamed protein product [Nippostrongylus brasiliensis]